MLHRWEGLVYSIPLPNLAPYPALAHNRHQSKVLTTEGSQQFSALQSLWRNPADISTSIPCYSSLTANRHPVGRCTYVIRVCTTAATHVQPCTQSSIWLQSIWCTGLQSYSIVYMQPHGEMTAHIDPPFYHQVTFNYTSVRKWADAMPEKKFPLVQLGSQKSTSHQGLD